MYSTTSDTMKPARRSAPDVNDMNLAHPVCLICTEHNGFWCLSSDVHDHTPDFSCKQKTTVYLNFQVHPNP